MFSITSVFDFIALRLNALWSKIKTKLISIQQCLHRARNRIRMRFRKKFVICSHDLPFHIAISCVVVGRRSNNASLEKVKWFLRKEKFSPLNDAWKDYLKVWDWWNSQSFQSHCSRTPQGRFAAPHMKP